MCFIYFNNLDVYIFELIIFGLTREKFLSLCTVHCARGI